MPAQVPASLALTWRRHQLSDKLNRRRVRALQQGGGLLALLPVDAEWSPCAPEKANRQDKKDNRREDTHSTPDHHDTQQGILVRRVPEWAMMGHDGLELRGGKTPGLLLQAMVRTLGRDKGGGRQGLMVLLYWPAEKRTIEPGTNSGKAKCGRGTTSENTLGLYHVTIRRQLHSPRRYSVSLSARNIRIGSSG